jgi:signal transduction histidine kinase
VGIDYHTYPVLFVDDEEANRIVFQAVFGKEFEVLLARGGEEALELVEHRQVAVMIADQRMPGMSGVELIAAVRERCPEVVRVMVTAYADIRTAVDAINRGQVARFFSKPWNSVEVRGYLRTTLEIFHLNRQLEELQLRMLRSERLATLGLAASSIAHDLGNPLTTLLSGLDAVDLEIQGLCEELTDDLELGTRIHELQQVLRGCKSPADEIVRVLKAVRRSIHAESHREPVRLVTVVEAALRLLRSELVQRARLRVNLDPEVTVLGDAAELMQVAINLLANAAGALPFGRQNEHRIEVQLRAIDGAAELVVTDTGCGIPPELHGRIFEPLFTTRVEQGGTGLGLAIAKRIVDAHGGRIEVVSAPGQGATFSVWLPRQLTPSG